MISADFLAFGRDFFIQNMPGTALICRRAKEDVTEPSTGGDGFGGVSTTLGGDTDGDGFVDGNTYPARLMQSPTRFNVAEEEVASSATGRIRLLLALPRDAVVALEDRVKYSDPDQTLIELEIISIDPHVQGLTLGLIVQQLI